MRICIDIDSTICQTFDTDYASSTPILEAVKAIQGLKDNGAYIILNTARGTGSGLDHSELTKSQLQSWGVPYDELHFGKPFADFYVDDKAVSANDWHSALGAVNVSPEYTILLNKFLSIH